MLRPNTNWTLALPKPLNSPRLSPLANQRVSLYFPRVSSLTTYLNRIFGQSLWYTGPSGRVKLAPKVKAAETAAAKEV